MTAVAMVSFVLLGLSGCAPSPDAQTRSPFSEKDFEVILAEGSGRIYGRAFLTTLEGEVKVAAGNTVQLWPAPAFMKEVLSLQDRGYNVTNYTQAVVRKIRPYMRESLGDAQGNFEFTDLPAGDYLLQVTITWEVHGQYGSSTASDHVRTIVPLGEAQALKVVLTR